MFRYTWKSGGVAAWFAFAFLHASPLAQASAIQTQPPEKIFAAACSTCHGAGRVMSRAKARKTVRGERLRQELEERGIAVQAGSMAGLAEEAPLAYKDVSRVVNVVAKAGIGRRVARLEPVAVIKG